MLMPLPPNTIETTSGAEDSLGMALRRKRTTGRGMIILELGTDMASKIEDS